MGAALAKPGPFGHHCVMDRSPDTLVIGAAHWDVIGCSTAPIATGDDMPGQIRTSPGGVALNIAHALARAGLRPALLSVIGTDTAGQELVSWLQIQRIDTRFLHREGSRPTDRYMAIEGPEGLVAAIADSTALEHHSTHALAPLATPELAGWRGPIVADSGLSPEVLQTLACRGVPQARPLRLTSAAPAKAWRLRPFLQAQAACFTLNRQEAEALLARPLPDSVAAAKALLAAGATRAIITDGPRAITDADRHATLTLPPPPVTVRRVTGAGDVFLATHLAAESRGLDRSAALLHALNAAALHISTPQP